MAEVSLRKARVNMDLLSRFRERFAQSRVVIFRDPQGEYAEEVDGWGLEDVNVVRVDGRPFGLKHRILREDPTGKYLIYLDKPEPELPNNWILDLELAYGVMSADRGTMLADDLGLRAPKQRNLIQRYSAFFNSGKRVEALRKLLSDNDDSDRLQAKMVAVILGSRFHTLKDLIPILLEENAADETKKIDDVVKFGLGDFHWSGVQQIYEYPADNPSMDDFVVWMLQRARLRFREDHNERVYNNLKRDFTTWRNDIHFRETLRSLANRVDESLRPNTSETDWGELLGDTVFASADREIIRRTTEWITEGNTHEANLSEIISGRSRDTLWNEDFAASYECLIAALELQKLIEPVFHIEDFDSGLQKYANEWCVVDRKYRDFVTAYDKSGEMQEELRNLSEHVERLYINRFLVPLNEAWTKQVAGMDTWHSELLREQRNFFAYFVKPLIASNNKKAVVIISDAMRYEVAEELTKQLNQEDRYTAEIEPVLGVLPSYTQLGMASLLPHQTLEFSGKDDLVLVDGKPAGGTENRTKILAPFQGIAIQAEDILKTSGEKLRPLLKDHRVVYIFHNVIDATGDNSLTESKVFSACQEALKEIMALVKKMASANATNIFITADHGFLYQASELDATKKLSIRAPEGEGIVDVHRRYVLEREPKSDGPFHAFTAKQLGLRGDIGAKVPNSIMRVPQSGKGSRYVHGGAALQEIVVPVVKVNKGRATDVRPVKVSINQKIDKVTTNDPPIELIQDEPISEKVQPRTMYAGFFTTDGVELSNQVEVKFDLAEDELANRKIIVRPILKDTATSHNGETVELRLWEKVGNTNQTRVVARTNYTMQISFGRDFG